MADANWWEWIIPALIVYWLIEVAIMYWNENEADDLRDIRERRLSKINRDLLKRDSRD